MNKYKRHPPTTETEIIMLKNELFISECESNKISTLPNVQKEGTANYSSI